MSDTQDVRELVGSPLTGVDELDRLLEECRLCPRRCGARRIKGETGPCGAGSGVRLASATIHKGEEPPISGRNGSATFFFSHCPLSCQFCQNYPISQLGHGRDVSIAYLSKRMRLLAARGAHNLNIVTGTHFAPHIIAAVASARAEGLAIPVLWNTSGYETEETIDKLAGTVDIYLTDIKYTDDRIARRLSYADNYFTVATRAARRMLDQVGPLEVDENGLAKKGVIIRHLVLPRDLADTAGVMRYIAKRLGFKVPISLMGQFFPAFHALDFPELNRPLYSEEYEAAKAAVHEAGLRLGWFQDMDNPLLKRGA